MNIKRTVSDLVNKYNTTCPFELASCLNIHLIGWALNEEINGYYKYDKRNQYIVYNINLSDEMQRVVCAHELGHAVLHPRANTPFMRKNTLFSVDRMEKQANTFAAELLIPDDALYCCEQPTVYDISARYEVPEALVKLKFK